MKEKTETMKKYKSPRNIALAEIRNDFYSQHDFHMDLCKRERREPNFEYRLPIWFINWFDLPQSTECMEYLNSPEITKLNKLAIDEYEYSLAS